MKKRNIWDLVVSLILILVLTLGTGCSLLPSVTTSPTPTATSPPATSPTPTQTATPINPIDSKYSISLPQSQAPILPSIADVVAKVKPSVVAINVKISYEIFGRSAIQEGAGSGWILREDGLIVTNNHVVENAQTIAVTLDDGRTFTADLKTVATDPLTDLAIFKIDAKNLPAVTVGDSSKLRLGDWVVAIGNSLGLGVSPSEGIVRS